MDTTFLIDGRLVFHSGRNELASLAKPDVKEVLNEPCARCLEAMLRTPGHIISQAELYKAGWGDGAKDVSPNTLYQNILLARKALKNVSESDEEFIITLPRKGFRFNEELLVVTQDSFVQEYHPENTPSPETKNAINVDKNPVPLLLSRQLTTFLIPASFIFIVAALAIFLLGSYEYKNSPSEDFTSDYIYSMQQSGCDIYFNRKGSMQASEREKMFKTWPVLTSNCGTFPQRYITAYRNHLSVFYLSCNSKDKANRICRSGYLRMSR